MKSYLMQIGSLPALIAARTTGDWSGVETSRVLDGDPARSVARRIARESGVWVAIWDEFAGGRHAYQAREALALADGSQPAGNREWTAAREAAALRTLIAADAQAAAAASAVMLWEAGGTDITEIAALCGVTRPTVYARLRAAGYEPTDR